MNRDELVPFALGRVVRNVNDDAPARANKPHLDDRLAAAHLSLRPDGYIVSHPGEGMRFEPTWFVTDADGVPVEPLMGVTERFNVLTTPMVADDLTTWKDYPPPAPGWYNATDAGLEWCENNPSAIKHITRWWNGEGWGPMVTLNSLRGTSSSNPKEIRKTSMVDVIRWRAPVPAEFVPEEDQKDQQWLVDLLQPASSTPGDVARVSYSQYAPLKPGDVVRVSYSRYTNATARLRAYSTGPEWVGEMASLEGKLAVIETVRDGWSCSLSSGWTLLANDLQLTWRDGKPVKPGVYEVTRALRPDFIAELYWTGEHWLASGKDPYEYERQRRAGTLNGSAWHAVMQDWQPVLG